ncbi:MAG: DUF4143 domain-containing protein [Acidobacteria bacterium]|nr:DUF4143 domain-containing protein [Acidobacteriota bacterium]
MPPFGIRIPSQTPGRFWTMLAHYHGQVWHGAELARAFAIAESAVRRWRKGTGSGRGGDVAQLRCHGSRGLAREAEPRGGD